MKRFFTSLFLLVLVGASLFAQAPEKFTYQAVVRNADNSLVVNAPVGVRVSILQGGVNGTLVYMETQTAVTNDNGLITLQIGSGNVQQGSFADIGWAVGSYFLKTETDLNGGTNYSITSTQQLLSVPYALYAKDAGNSFSGDYNDLTNTPQIPTVPTNVSAFTNDAGYITGYTETDPQFNAWDKDYNDLTNKPTIPTVPTNVSAFTNDAGYLTSFTEQQILTISHDTIFLTGGSFVKLPSVGGCDTAGMAALLAQVQQLQRPSVSTLSVNNVSYHGAYVTGRLFNSGSYWISGCGFCWSTSQNPTLSNNHLTAASDLGTFGLNLTGLDAGTTYYVRAYATNSAGTTYGEQLSFTTTSASLPTVTTSTVSNITASTATCGGNVAANGGETVTARGVCWSTSQNPTTSNNHTFNGTGNGSFTSSITGLNANTTYYVRAYATNSQGTAYGAQKSFTTANNGNPNDGQPCSGTPTVTDHEGNVYNTVQIGDQCWTRENLRTTTSPSTGTYLIPDAGTGYTYTGKQAHWYYNDSATYAPMNYGLLYNWNAAADTFNAAYGETSVNTDNSNAVSVSFTGHRRGICPAGWHLPSDAEWTVLTDYVSSQDEYICGGDSSYIAKALASTTGWSTSTYNCAVGNDQSVNNASGFGAVPAGRWLSWGDGWSDPYYNEGHSTSFWSSTEHSSDSIIYCILYSGGASVGHWDDGFSRCGFSVRCLRDSDGGGGSSATLPTVTTSTVGNITESTATCGGNVTADGGSSVTARGVCWSTSQNPTVSGNHTTDGSGMGSFTSSITGLTAGTTYYVRAYSVNSVGTAYGNEVSFTTTPIDTSTTHGIPCPNMPTVTDHEGNVYNTVQIGDQCWMKENLRTTTSPSTGTYLIPPASTNYTFTGKQARWCFNDSAMSTLMNYGLLYNWNAAVDTFNTAYGETSVNTNNGSAVWATFGGHRRGICPAGWHLPSDAEWTALTDYVSSQSEYICGGDSSYIAKALASETSWPCYGGECYPGCGGITANNATGFSAVSAGYCYGSSFSFEGIHAGFWSSSQCSDYPSSSWTRGLDSTNAYVGRGGSNKCVGVSVRCVRDTYGGGGSSVSLPTVTTGTVSNITASTAICGGNVISDGGATVTVRGICWSTSQNPTISDNLTTDGGGTGSFTSSMYDLTYNTTYYVRAYATNGQGTAYGEQQSFTTAFINPNHVQPCPGTPTVTDHEGNVYNTVQIGDQCWMKENLRTTTSPSTGTYLIPASGTGYTYTGKQACWYNNDSATYAPMNYGLLYNWNAATDTFNTAYGETSVNTSYSNAVSVTFNGHRRGICPVGWHLPSREEWTALRDYASSQSDYTCYAVSSYIAKALASEAGWDTCTYNCTIGNDQSANNASGFSATPAGWLWGSSFKDVGLIAVFWTVTQNGGATCADDCWFSFDRAYISFGTNYKKYYGQSVRCIRDSCGGGGSSATLPTVTTGTVSDITASTATCGGNVTADGESSVTARGVCWSTSLNPTVSGNHTTDGSGIGSFTSSITGLNANTTYYVRAYATNSVGTAYGETVAFTNLYAGGTTIVDAKSCPATPTVTDHEGNIYATVQIGDQCWMRDNLRTTTSPSTGTYIIPAVSANYTFTGKQARWYQNDSAWYAPRNYGLLYNWNAAVDTFNTSYGETSVNTSSSNAVSVTFTGHRRGICPVGWHLPNDAEWTTMTDYVSSQSEYVCGDTTINIAKTLASTTGWNSSTSTCVVGNNQSANNATGFSAIPVGTCIGSSFGDKGRCTWFWSATQSASYTYYTSERNLCYDNANVCRSFYDDKYLGYSVRCLRD